MQNIKLDQLEVDEDDKDFKHYDPRRKGLAKEVKIFYYSKYLDSNCVGTWWNFSQNVLLDVPGLFAECSIWDLIKTAILRCSCYEWPQHVSGPICVRNKKQYIFIYHIGSRSVWQLILVASDKGYPLLTFLR